MSLVQVRDLEVRAGSRRLFVLDSFEAKAGEIIGLSGANGKGKTTLLKLLAGLSRPVSGSVQWNEKITSVAVPLRNSSRVRRGLAYMAASPALLLDQTVEENLEFIANSYGRIPSRIELAAVCEQFALKGRGLQVVRSLSTGQKRRLVLASLELVRPLLLLADEPTNGLDREGREICLGTLKRDCAEGMLCIVASHDSFLLEQCDRVIEIENLVSASPKRPSLQFL